MEDILKLVNKTNPAITQEKLVEMLKYSTPATVKIMLNIAKER